VLGKSSSLIVDMIQYMVQLWVFHDGSLPRDAFDQIEILMDVGLDPILLVGNLATSGQAIHEMFLDSNESLFEVYFGSGLVPINEYRFGSHGVQSWLGLIKMLGSDLFGIDFLILQGIK
jgi:hypothetical protein